MNHEPDDDARRPGSPADRYPELPPVDVVVPDDPRELEPEARRVRRELRALARRQWFLRRLPTRRWQRYGLTTPLVVVVLLMAALVGAGITLFTTTAGDRLQPRPLASAPTGTVGGEGGLLPDVTLEVSGQSVAARSLRPAVLLLLPAQCQCDQTVRSVARQAQSLDLASYVVASRRGDGLDSAVRAAGNGTAPAVDPGGRLAARYDSSGVTVLAVAPDGVVAAVVRDIAPGQRLEGQLVRVLDQAPAS